MPKNKKKEKIISSHNWSSLEAVSVRLKEVQYLLRLCLNDEECNPTLYNSERSVLMFSCVELLGNISSDVADLQNCIRNGEEFRGFDCDCLVYADASTP